MSPLKTPAPSDTQQALYSLPQNDYNVINSGYNGYTASAGYNLVTGLGTPVANLLVSDLVAYQTGTLVASGPTVAPLQNSELVNTGPSDSGTMDVFSVFDSITVTQTGFTHGRAAVALGSAGETGLARRPPVSADKVTTAVDRAVVVMVDETSPETLIGDLAFEQVSSGTHKKPRGWSLYSR